LLQAEKYANIMKKVNSSSAALIMIVLTVYNLSAVDLVYARDTRPVDVLGVCENLPGFLVDDVESINRDLAFGARPFWNGSGGIASVVVIMDQGQCTAGRCFSHFFRMGVDGVQCRYHFSSYLERDTPLAVSVVAPAKRDILSKTDVDQCQVVFSGFCY